MVTAFYLPSLGGIQYYVSSLTKALGLRGHHVDILTVNTESVAAVEQSLAGAVMRCRLDHSYHRGLVSTELARRLLSARGYDAIHVHAPFPLGVELAAVATRLNKIPMIVTHHGTGGKPDRLYTAVAGLYDRIFRRVTLRAASRVVFLTPSYRATVSLPAKVSQRVVIVRTGVDADRFRPASSESTRAALDLTSDDHVGLWVGSLSEHNRYKGIDYLLRALAQARQTSLVIVGEGTLRAELESLARELGVTGRVRFVGAVDNEYLPAYYAAADFFVLPSVSGPENSPVVLFEAMASGLPLITTAIPGVEEIVGESKGGVTVPPRDAGALATAMDTLLAEPERRRNLGSNGRTYAVRQSWSTCAEDMEGIYTAATGRSAGLTGRATHMDDGFDA